VYRSKHVEPSINFGIINSITKLHIVGISTEYFKAYKREEVEKYRRALTITAVLSPDES